jgi:septal ring factor EnvC (AmiA/AmiB activator)
MDWQELRVPWKPPLPPIADLVPCCSCRDASDCPLGRNPHASRCTPDELREAVHNRPKPNEIALLEMDLHDAEEEIGKLKEERDGLREQVEGLKEKLSRAHRELRELEDDGK